MPPRSIAPTPNLVILITMKTLLLLPSLLAAVIAHPNRRATDGYVQNSSGTASFTMYSGCGSPGE